MPEEKKTKFCSNCGAEIDVKAKICPKCGVEQPIIPEKVSNWWYIFAIIFGIIGGIIAWAVNKDRNPKKAIRFLIVGLVWPIISIIGILSSVVLVSLGGAREKAKDARVMADMNQLRTTIEIYSLDHKDSYSGVNCSLTELSSICSDIKEYLGEMPTIKSAIKNYCLYVKLPSGKYYCLTESSFGRETTIFPGGSGYCDGITFSCP
jgi:type II secretory pathway pseudopilin PulG/RNA polymerase subunit RPABC4/transcription elongation factor Spt4